MLYLRKDSGKSYFGFNFTFDNLNDYFNLRIRIPVKEKVLCIYFRVRTLKYMKRSKFAKSNFDVFISNMFLKKISIISKAPYYKNEELLGA